jgi:hypothetical protein
MKTRITLAALLAITALPALASDVSPFYKNQFVVTERESCAKGSPAASETSPFYRNQFVVTKAEACAAAAAKDAAAARAQQMAEGGHVAAIGSERPGS